ncbi:hypothetical protein SERLA73DRAFT_46034 [Serpula lacrymans var. lacrymans S7.3]|uniref:5-formyltetrahydrofolate cyclo-ligase n=1 Tax=Serpula lacrymans var. lacrymans (strain S7.3) TaxID=936435 RepID=F8PIS2_SERL3|nr:hypothetical protein SERLA73DRAFT_46034 [Serpula lacrymans var. lacrymans S7.3]
MSILQTALQYNKKVMRKAMTAKLRELQPSDIQTQSQAIASRITSLSVFQRCRTVSCYLSMPTGEVDTSSIVTDLLRVSDKSLFVPMIKSGNLTFVKLYGEDDLRSLSSGLWNIKEPTSTWRNQELFDEDCDPLDLILVPGVAFDRSFSRLGHGKGYYDQFIASYTSESLNNSKSRPLLVALSFRQQLGAEGQVPTADHDWKMDMIVTPDEILIRDGISDQ